MALEWIQLKVVLRRTFSLYFVTRNKVNYIRNKKCIHILLLQIYAYLISFVDIFNYASSHIFSYCDFFIEVIKDNPLIKSSLLDC